jgi:hypothetical protein
MKLTKEDIKKYGTKLEQRQLIESKIYGSSTSFTQKDVSNISRKIDFDIYDAYDFCLQLLEDVNAHEMMAKVEKLFEEDYNDSDAQDYRTI